MRAFAKALVFLLMIIIARWGTSFRDSQVRLNVSVKLDRLSCCFCDSRDVV